MLTLHVRDELKNDPTLTAYPYETIPYQGKLVDREGYCVAIIRQCMACEEWIERGTPDENGGGLTLAGEWKCANCFREKKPLKIRFERPGAKIVIPPEFMTASLNDFGDKLGRALKRWTFSERQQGSEPFMAIYGIPGCGKSRAACALMKVLARKGTGCLRKIAPEAQSEWVGSFTPSARTAVERTLKTASTLVLENINKCTVSPAWATFISTLLEVRIENKLPTLLTSQSQGKQLGDVYGADVYSLLQRFEWVELPRVDHRVEERTA